IGVKAIVDALLGGPDHVMDRDPTRGLSLVVFSIATSVDAFAVGISLAMIGVAIWIPALVIGVVTSALTTVGMLIGARIGPRLGRGAAIVGGVVLIAIGLRILASHGV
ncbi:MAG TPA: manganese efflux pump, partial [Candidatus Hydrogenedentes bacterium]|nr:manganese efflux pump [Candidatus Hydrogenedentota bacterium]